MRNSSLRTKPKRASRVKRLTVIFPQRTGRTLRSRLPKLKQRPKSR